MRPAASLGAALLLLLCAIDVQRPLAADRRSVADALAAPQPSTGCGGTTRPALRGDRQQMTVGDDARSFLIDAPAGDPERPRPLVLAFHGYRSNAENQRLGTGMIGLAERKDIIVVYPDGHEGVRLLGSVGRGWDLDAHETRDLDFVRALLDRIEGERCVDRRRIYATGMSNGGFFANLVGCRLADRVAAIAPVAGAMALPACVPARPVPVLLTFGRADDVVPPAVLRSARDWWARVAGCGRAREDEGCTRYEGCAADVVACEGPQAHTWPRDATDRIWRFFEAHPRT